MQRGASCAWNSSVASCSTRCGASRTGRSTCALQKCATPQEGAAAACQLPSKVPQKPVEFFPYPEVPKEAVEKGRRIVTEGGLDVAGIEYLEASDGRHIFFDVNANSNLRPPIARAFGFDPFERVVDFLVEKLRSA